MDWWGFLDFNDNDFELQSWQPGVPMIHRARQKAICMPGAYRALPDAV